MHLQNAVLFSRILSTHEFIASRMLRLLSVPKSNHGAESGLLT
jgi:hypothetical protein